MSDENERRLAELSTAEAMAYLFPKEVIELADQVVLENDRPRPERPARQPRTPPPSIQS